MAFGSFLLAGSLWLFVTSNNTYTTIIDMPIEARNLSAQHALNKEVPKIAKVKLKGTGRSLFKSYLLKSFFPNFKLVIDLERISKEYSFILNDYFERYPQKVSIPSNFELEYIEVVYPNRIQISLDEYKEKIVDVVVNANISTAPGFTKVGDYKIFPEKIKIAGPKDIIDKTNFIYTEQYIQADIKNEIQTKLSLVANTEDLIELTPSEILFKQKIEMISERIISEIPVRIENIIDQYQVFLSPQTVSLTVVGGIEFISSLNPDSIDVSVDFSNWSSSKQFYPISVKMPKNILKWMDLSPQNIELIVTKSIE
tara:strand:+ start:5423 stop:6358 length:936 start_codon:yes stop_codon:yes gene_type:complete